MKFVSLIFIHYAMSPKRSELMRVSMASLLESIDYPIEIIVVDNGESDEDTNYLLELCKNKKINTYVRNSHNLHFGFARNQGIAISNGDYIAIVDNDIVYKKGWLSGCVKVLDDFPDEKIYAAPFCDRSHNRQKYWSKELTKDNITYRLNMRAGSNCFVARREDFEKIGLFPAHRIAGTKWTNRAVGMGYLAAVVPGNLATDMAFRRGYNLKMSLPVYLELKLGDVYFNIDEFKKVNPNLEYISQKTKL